MNARVLTLVLCSALVSCSHMMDNYGDPDNNDPVMPNATFSINNGDAFCYTTHVTLTTSFSGLTSVSFSEDTDAFASSLQPLSSYPWKFDYSTGLRTVYCRYVDMYGRTGITDASITYLDRISLENSDMFGRTVAANYDLSEIAVSSLVSGKGQVHLFSRSTDEWVHAKLDLGSDASAMTGYSLSFDQSGSALYIGNPGSDSNTGQIFVMTRNGPGSWSLSQTIDGVSSDNYFGYAIAASMNGNLLAVSSIGDGSAFTGLARLFTTISGNWVKSTDLTPSPLDGDDSCRKFGKSLAVNSDGTVIAVGDPEYNVYSSGTTVVSGRVIVFRSISGTYTPSDLYESDASTLSLSTLPTGCRFGDTVSITADGTILAVGVPRRNKGEVWMYHYDSTGAKFVKNNILASPPGGTSSDSYHFGLSLSFSQSGRLFIGADSFCVNGLGSKCGRIFYSDPAYTALKQYTTPDASPDDWFGYRIAVSADGTSVASSSPYRDIDGKPNAGAVYIIRNMTVFQ